MRLRIFRPRVPGLQLLRPRVPGILLRRRPFHALARPSLRLRERVGSVRRYLRQDQGPKQPREEEDKFYDAPEFAEGTASSGSSGNSQGDQRGFYTRLRERLRNTKVEWYPIPVGLGIAVVAFTQYRKISDREHERIAHEGTDGHVDIQGPAGERVRSTGPWQVYVLSTLPLRAISRLWGRFNEIQLPVWMRVPGFKLYAWVFGCNLNEVGEADLTTYRNLAEFFYRELKPGVRPIDATAAIVSPADGKILHFGAIQGRQVEQVKGLTYSLDALLGSGEHPSPEQIAFDARENSHISDSDFATVNGIDYTVDTLLGEEDHQKAEAGITKTDASMPAEHEQAAEQIVAQEVARCHGNGEKVKDGNALFFTVVYLAPGDYHRFHSPTNWVVERRRHFAGELFSVSPFLARRLANLFVLNERVVLLGRWKHGFMSMTPVGATNVGSIRIHFDRELRTNTWSKDKPVGVAYAEATYANASKALRGQPCRVGEQMGGFNLGSTVVLVFEAPVDFQFKIEAGQKVKMGQAIGVTPEH
ncbi:phosphatidylserine decarboxylase [Saitoella complicata NRRL Y-17804]|uniref:phosphatidylserine decarboxylase n=1 Tax=Saitoella complicata (strain BCRC 22490 / CBS 7301 / JCM 7358 / NBRC 10748 / NRRL Y-17804) TaxID=698492 RepID=UPI000866EC9A|nr:phosphatidylserine decarboxylase [Saitoella complicata NRRL Y-17804]ODQ56037.1 phosphatidylserine decarboxylase [Saitoella complicata NRRL Y-17804]